MFCAFQPNRVIVPSFPLVLKCPEMPSDDRKWESVATDACKLASGVASTKPVPNVGVGMRKMILFEAIAAAKSGCARWQFGASDRPAIVKRSCTPPSGVPSGLRMNRASRTGPFDVMNDGTVLVAPIKVATATCGFGRGPTPPAAG